MIVTGYRRQSAVHNRFAAGADLIKRGGRQPASVLGRMHPSVAELTSQLLRIVSG
jgi:hypothetical protein